MASGYWDDDKSGRSRRELQSARNLEDTREHEARQHGLGVHGSRKEAYRVVNLKKKYDPHYLPAHLRRSLERRP